MKKLSDLISAAIGVAATFGVAAAFGATPLAVWDGANTSLGGLSLTAQNGNTIQNNVITIASGTTGGVVYTGAASSLNNCTFIIRCSGLDLAKASSTLSPATGWSISKMAVFGSTLSEAEILEYAFPSDVDTIAVNANTTVSALNALSAASSGAKIILSVADGVEIAVDTAFVASVPVEVASSGTITLSANAQPDASYFSAVSFAVQGALLRSWLTPGVVGFNFNANGGRGGRPYGRYVHPGLPRRRRQRQHNAVLRSLRDIRPHHLLLDGRFLQELQGQDGQRDDLHVGCHGRRDDHH